MMWEVERCDHYFVEVEAKTKKEALKRCNEEEEFLNNGNFGESTFKVIGRA
jgi:hypothetical protein